MLVRNIFQGTNNITVLVSVPCLYKYFVTLQSELAELLELQSPDSTPSSQRAALQQVAEDASFSAEHYLADWAEEGLLVAPLLQLNLPWEDQENCMR